MFFRKKTIVALVKRVKV